MTAVMVYGVCDGCGGVVGDREYVLEIFEILNFLIFFLGKYFF
jgi:hypothetical protein